jgi:hypothetical protein
MFFASLSSTLNTMIYSMFPAVSTFITRLFYTRKANILATYLIDARTTKILPSTFGAFEAFS